MIPDIYDLSDAEKERISLERIEKMLEKILAEADSRSAEAHAQSFETLPAGAKRMIAMGLDFDPNGGRLGLTKLEEERVDVEEIGAMAESFLRDVRHKLALIRGEDGASERTSN